MLAMLHFSSLKNSNLTPSNNEKYGEWGWCSVESVCLPQLWSGFDFQTWPHMWDNFVGGSCPCPCPCPSSMGFLQVLRFSFPNKNQHSKFQIDRETVVEKNYREESHFSFPFLIPISHPHTHSHSLFPLSFSSSRILINLKYVYLEKRNSQFPVSY